MKQLGLMIDMDRCIGCKTCVSACRNSHKIVDHENCLPGQIPSYIRVESRTEGSYPMVREQCWVVPCQNCKNPPCLEACPSGAIVKDDQNGIVRILRDKCEGGKKCIEACPWNVIQFDEADGFAHKCDMCYDLVVFGNKPVCVEVCMTDEIAFGELETLKALARDRDRDRDRELDRKMSSMSVIYLKATPKNTLAEN